MRKAMTDGGTLYVEPVRKQRKRDRTGEISEIVE